MPHSKTPIAGNGLLDRRLFLQTGLALSLAPIVVQASYRPDYMSLPGAPLNPYGKPSNFEDKVTRGGISSQPGTMGSGASRTPLQHLQGTMTPSGLHFERHHAGIPDIDPDQHTLTVHGKVRQPLRFSLHNLGRYPMVTFTKFLECSGNSAAALSEEALDVDCSRIHGLVSQSEWTGVPVSYLLDEAGLDPSAQWVIAEGADAPMMNRSIPLEKMLDDAIVALYQNGERIRPEQGYPMRLFLPGFEGNASVKWLHRLEVSDIPAMSRQETSKYTDRRSDGRSEVFTFEMSVKSTITSPSPGLQLTEKGIYQISGLAWSGRGAIRSVEVSADGGKSWAEAELVTEPGVQALTRFRIPWHWQGQPAVIVSRARDDQGVQPSRDEWLAKQGSESFYHYNATQAWRIDERGQAKNVYL